MPSDTKVAHDSSEALGANVLAFPAAPSPTSANLIEVDFARASVAISDVAKALEAETAAHLAAATQGGLKGIKVNASDAYNVSPRAIYVEDDWNCRDFTQLENQQHVISLAHKIVAAGAVLVPLAVYYNRYTKKLMLRDGECRLRAVHYAMNVLGFAIPTVPVRTVDGSNDAEQIAEQVLYNSGKPFTPLEESRNIAKLLKFNWSIKQIAAKLGISQEKVQARIDLAQMPEQVRQEVLGGRITTTEAIRALKYHQGDVTAVLGEIAEAAKISADRGGKLGNKATPSAIKEARARRAPKDEGAVVEPKQSVRSKLHEVLSAADITLLPRNKASVVISREELKALLDAVGLTMNED